MASIDEQNVLTLLNREIKPGQSAKVNFNTAKLYTQTTVEVPIIIERSMQPGPVVLITSGIHGDEINGVEIVRQVIAKGINKPAKGTIICIPVVNVFGFLNMQREFPDGRDLNRMFPGSKSGPLASKVAYQFVEEILPIADYCLDFHTGGSSRFNAAQIRIDKSDNELIKLAHIFNAPFIVFSKTIAKSYRKSCMQLGKPVLLFEGGKSSDSNKEIAEIGVQGIQRVLSHLEMLREEFTPFQPKQKSIIIEDSAWMRAKYSGLLHVKIPIGKRVEKGEYIAIITDPYGSFRHKVKSTQSGYIINVNQSPIVYQGDAIFHISKDK
ncbi:succinylglutamate desuccinylase/aspartoacylase family protein [Mesonia aestuariivivens]|uniref:Succinylglutamate desuccinylase/aspartoacylase family protein n=1 Tax=Mesonia aestuariivivens TaxID=2796128 RepID=A0ABS6VYI1_9FLAO|nr:succinylglutamate desuccinylase/aspartoacylase family protein [Mesonia aestuariivivens]MBW2960326.1 succinylglutamate desuccinylase/aspartoacylase family protein [Mesonia aestuariivivens]